MRHRPISNCIRIQLNHKGVCSVLYNSNKPLPTTTNRQTWQLEICDRAKGQIGYVRAQNGPVLLVQSGVCNQYNPGHSHLRCERLQRQKVGQNIPVVHH